MKNTDPYIPSQWLVDMRRSFKAAIDQAVVLDMVSRFKRPFWSACWAWLRDDLT